MKFDQKLLLAVAMGTLTSLSLGAAEPAAPAFAQATAGEQPKPTLSAAAAQAKAALALKAENAKKRLSRLAGQVSDSLGLVEKSVQITQAYGEYVAAYLDMIRGATRFVVVAGKNYMLYQGIWYEIKGTVLQKLSEKLKKEVSDKLKPTGKVSEICEDVGKPFGAMPADAVVAILKGASQPKQATAQVKDAVQDTPSSEPVTSTVTITELAASDEVSHVVPQKIGVQAVLTGVGDGIRVRGEIPLLMPPVAQLPSKL